MSVLIWVQTVSKGYQQMKKIVAGRQRAISCQIHVLTLLRRRTLFMLVCDVFIRGLGLLVITDDILTPLCSKIINPSYVNFLLNPKHTSDTHMEYHLWFFSRIFQINITFNLYIEISHGTLTFLYPKPKIQ